ncbi:hypothetical protein FPV67DRAFT_1652117 [Lyophyllum atratum]|nr:hypothetical protein FPV67DRAFT_1652117 [Lyophyllum atratum]
MYAPDVERDASQVPRYTLSKPLGLGLGVQPAFTLHDEYRPSKSPALHVHRFVRAKTKAYDQEERVQTGERRTLSQRKRYGYVVPLNHRVGRNEVLGRRSPLRKTLLEPPSYHRGLHRTTPFPIHIVHYLRGGLASPGSRIRWGYRVPFTKVAWGLFPLNLRRACSDRAGRKDMVSAIVRQTSKFTKWYRITLKQMGKFDSRHQKRRRGMLRAWLKSYRRSLKLDLASEEGRSDKPLDILAGTSGNT